MWIETAHAVTVDVFSRDQSLTLLGDRLPSAASATPTRSPKGWVTYHWPWRRRPA
jgi:hypothetical protein